MDKYIIVTTLCDKKAIAEKIQNELLSKKLIAGSQISELESTHWWNNKIEKAHEYHIEMRTKEIFVGKELEEKQTVRKIRTV